MSKILWRNSREKIIYGNSILSNKYVKLIVLFNKEWY